MNKKDIIILIILIVMSAALAFIFFKLTNKGLAPTTEMTSQSNINSSEELAANANNNVNEANTNAEDNGGEVSVEMKFDKFFKIAYLAKFTGLSNPPVTSEFTKDDKIVLSVRVVDNLKTDLKMKVKIYKDDKEISSTDEISILDGEVGLKNPAKSGDYEARLFIDNALLKVLPFAVK